jgi:Holliday junction resolvasome RuvABC endonuclease subunit
MSAPRVIGLDPSLTGTGVAGLGWSETLGSVGNVEKDTIAKRHDRITGLAARVVELVGHADLVVIEAPAFDAKSTSGVDRAGLWWDIYRRLRSRDIPVVDITTGGLKVYATGVGGASKIRVVEQVARRLGDVWEDLGGDDNRADAVVLCAMGLDRLGAPVVSMPANHRRALNAVRWPDLPALAVAGEPS